MRYSAERKVHALLHEGAGRAETAVGKQELDEPAVRSNHREMVRQSKRRGGGAGNLTVGLLPARTDTLWFHEYCAIWHYTFLVGRLKFKANGKEMQSAPFPSMLVFFGIPPR